MTPDRFVWAGVLDQLVDGIDLDEPTARAVMDEIMDGRVDPVIVAALLAGLRSKGEAAPEVTGFVRAMLDHAAPIEVDGPLVDTCGTGGDRAGTFNVSSIAALVIAAAGCRVAKHGNRAASSKVGSADLFEHFGVVIDLAPDSVAACIREVGIGFLYARTFHPAMRHVAPVRAALGIRTVFNVLGPLSNPAGAGHQVVGVADRAMAPVMAGTLAALGCTHALVVHGHGGMDELSTTGPNQMWEIQAGEVTTAQLDPRDLDLAPATLADLQGGDVEANGAIAHAILAGKASASADLVALNAGAGLYVADAVDDIAAGVQRAREVLSSGAAATLLTNWVELSQRLAD